jgi:hypothetical protein
MRVAMQSILLDEFTIAVFERVVELVKTYLTPGQMVRIIGEDGEEGVQALQQSDFDAQFDLDLDVGRALPFDEEREQAKSAELMELIGPIPPIIERVLDAYGVRDKDEVIMLMQTQGVLEEIGEAMEAGDPEAARAIMENFIASMEQEQEPPESGSEGGEQ